MQLPKQKTVDTFSSGLALWLTARLISPMARRDPNVKFYRHDAHVSAVVKWVVFVPLWRREAQAEIYRIYSIFYISVLRSKNLECFYHDAGAWSIWNHAKTSPSCTSDENADPTTDDTLLKLGVAGKNVLFGTDGKEERKAKDSSWKAISETNCKIVMKRTRFLKKG